MPPTHPTMTAEVLALRALAWIAEDEDRLASFLALTGAGPTDLRDLAQDQAFLAGLLDHLLSDDALVMGFCDAAGLPYEAPAQARMHLAGGDLPHWT